MNLQELLRVLRTRWMTIAACTVTSLFAGVLINIASTPIYEASSRLYVSTTVGASASELYQGNRLSQERVLSYVELLKGLTLAERTVDKLQLDIGAEELSSRISAKAKLDTVLIDVRVRDESPVRARDIVNALSDEFVSMIRVLETPRPGAQPDARVIVEQRAVAPEEPISPKTVRNIVIAILLGLVAGVAIAMLRDHLDNTVKGRDAVTKIAQVGVAGEIPLDRRRRESAAINFESDASLSAEAFRKLRTNLKFLAVDDPPRVIVVTSAAPSEGKSTTSINTALALAEADHSVVLVDGDMRRPSLHKYLNLVGSVGFSTVLSGSAELEEALQSTSYPRFSVLSSGVTPPNPSELCGSLAAKRVLKELGSQFDYVIIDSPPLLAVTDAAILSTSADGVLLISRYGKTTTDQLATAVENLRSVGGRLLGSVITMIPTRGPGSYTYSYKYDYSPQ